MKLYEWRALYSDFELAFEFEHVMSEHGELARETLVVQLMNRRSLHSMRILPLISRGGYLGFEWCPDHGNGRY